MTGNVSIQLVSLNNHVSVYAHFILDFLNMFEVALENVWSAKAAEKKWSKII